MRRLWNDIGIRTTSACTAVCQIGFTGSSQTYTCQTNGRLNVGEGNKMKCFPIKCVPKNILGMKPDAAFFASFEAPLGVHIGPPGKDYPGDVSSFYTMGEKRYGKRSGLFIGQFIGREMGSEFLLECLLGYRPVVVARDPSTEGAYLSTTYVPTPTQTVTGTPTLVPAPNQKCSSMAKWLRPEPFCRRLQCSPIYLPGGDVVLTAKPRQSIFAKNEHESTYAYFCSHFLLLSTA